MRTATMRAPERVAGSSAVLHGSHPLRGYPVTWRITPLRREAGAAATYLVEHADGDLQTDEAWQDAERDESVMNAYQVRELIARVRGPLPAR
ncbi:hypothetical protein [Actinotalea sp.]|uniref:hypothetical protein n=1 Tax=Actinotalea sp. TaxID=1872145 RepID=UPI00356A6215